MERQLTTIDESTTIISGEKGLTSLAYDIIGCSFDVFNELGYGFLEKVYEGAMEVALIELGFDVERQKKMCVYFRGKLVGEYFADIIVNDLIIIEFKVSGNIEPIHRIQLLNYLKTSNKELGIIIAFTKGGIKYQKVANTKNIVVD